MLDFLRSVGGASDRKLRLFAVACYGRWPPGRHDRYRGVAEVAERHAEGTADYRELRAAHDQAIQANGGSTNPATAVVGMDAHRAAAWTAGEVAWAVGGDEPVVQAGLIRCIFGPLAFHTARLDPSCRTPAAVEIARLAYGERRFELMPALGAALSDAGCTDAEILGHCGKPGPHGRGCWVVDFLLSQDQPVAAASRLGVFP
jgi:hypothetical protein